MGCFKIKITSKNGDLFKEIDEDKFTIGRSKKADVIISEDSISREHILVSKVKDDIFVTDMETANGTTVEDTNIPSGSPYHYEDSKKIKLGNSDTVIRISFRKNDREKNNDHSDKKGEDDTVVSQIIPFDKEEPTGIIAIEQAEKKIRENKIKQIKIESEKALLESEQIALEARKRAKEEGLKIKKEASIKAQDILDKANLKLEQFKADKKRQQLEQEEKLKEIENNKSLLLEEIKLLEKKENEWKSKINDGQEEFFNKQSEYKNLESNIEAQKAKAQAEIEKKEAEFEIKITKKENNIGTN